MSCQCYGACTGESTNAWRNLVGQPEGKKLFGRPRCRWEDNIGVDLGEVEWIHLIQNREQWRALAKTEMKLRIPQKAGNFLVIGVVINF